MRCASRGGGGGQGHAAGAHANGPGPARRAPGQEIVCSPVSRSVGRKQSSTFPYLRGAGRGAGRGRVSSAARERRQAACPPGTCPPSRPPQARRSLGEDLAQLLGGRPVGQVACAREKGGGGDSASARSLGVTRANGGTAGARAGAGRSKLCVPGKGSGQIARGARKAQVAAAPFERSAGLGQQRRAPPSPAEPAPRRRRQNRALTHVQLGGHGDGAAWDEGDGLCAEG
jgi:hypothetical protein